MRAENRLRWAGTWAVWWILPAWLGPALVSTAAETGEDKTVASPKITVARQLGFGPAEKLLIIHGDDAGMCHSANVGTLEAMTAGVVSSASAMVPCPWFPEFAQMSREHPDLDVGLHLTLTSEWKHYRWRPVTPINQVPGLIDDEGFMFRDVWGVMTNAEASEVERELRAQVERALAFGMKPTHVDSHMGTLFARPDFFGAYRKVANEFGLPYLLPKLSEERLAKMDAGTRAMGKMILATMGDSNEFTVDDLVSISGDVPLEKQTAFYIDTIRGLKPGITEIIIHCGVDGPELTAVSGSHRRRDMDRRAFMDPAVKKVIAEEGVRLLTWREIGERQRKHLGLHANVKRPPGNTR